MTGKLLRAVASNTLTAEATMKVRQVFIIAVHSQQGDNAEVDNGAYQLAQRYGAYVVTLEHPALPSSSHWGDYITNSEQLQKDRYVISNTTADCRDTGERVGVYILSHGGTGKVANLTGDQWGALIKALGFEFISKLCLVTCYGASTQAADGSACQSFLQLLCLSLAPQLTPMIAAYDGYVTVMFPGMNLKRAATVPDAKGVTASKMVGGTQLDQMKTRAQKIGQKKPGDGQKLGNKVIMQAQSQDFKDRIKIIYQFRNGQPAVVPLGEWTDKGR
jgi:hypothetical protein